MATPVVNEKRLDQAEAILKQVLKDVRYHITDYDVSDYRKLQDALIALNKVTLRKDI